MKISRLASVLILLIVGTSIELRAATPPVLKPALFSKIYVPMGFDSNDQVQLVGEGFFPNTCYRPSNVTVRIDAAAKKIFLGPAAYEYHEVCLQVVLPFQRTVEIGILAPGKWKVIQDSDQQQLGELVVVQAKLEAADDFPYAPITQAFFRQEPGALQILLTGNFVSNCMSLSEVKLVISTDVIVVQPIVQMENRNNCMSGKFAFKTWSVIDFLRKNRYLLHVRSMNGNAINNLVDVD